MEHQSITINCQRILLPKSYLKFIFFDFSFTVIAFYSFLDNLVLHYLPNICASLTTKFKLIHLTYNVGNSKNGLPKIRKCLLPLPAEVHLDPDFSSPFQWTKKWVKCSQYNLTLSTSMCWCVQTADKRYATQP